MTFTFTALLCLGLTLGLWIPVLTGAYSKPSLSAQTDLVVTTGGYVTLKCEPLHYHHTLILTVEGPQKPSWRKEPKCSYNRKCHVLFYVGPLTSNQRWIFRCYSYDTHTQVSSAPSEPVEILVSGKLQKPTIKAEPGSVICSGSTMTIWCQGDLDAKIFFLYKEGSHNTQSTQTLQQPGNKAQFFIPSVTQGDAGQYRCYCYSSAGWSEPSDTLELVVTGIYNFYALRLSGLPSPVVPEGGNLTLHCTSHSNYDKFILTKEDQKFTSSLDAEYISSTGQHQALFVMGPMTPNYTGTFRCYGYYKHTPLLWSEPSNLLKIFISGQIDDTLSLSVKPNSTVHSGENVTLLCWSTYSVDTFILSKEGSGQPPLQLKSKFQDQQYQSEFSMSAVTTTYSGTYRCYGSRDSSLYLLSFASAPVELIVSGPIEASSWPTKRFITKAAPENWDHTMENLIRMGMAVLVLIVLSILAAEAWQSHRQTHHAAGK